MAQCCLQHVLIRGIATCTGQVVRAIDEDAPLYADDPLQLDRLKRVLGLVTRHIALPGTTTLDLCEQAAGTLLGACRVEPQTLDALICVTQTPDHLQPSNANILHGRLGLEKRAAAFDINQGCAGWVYGLYVAGLMVESGGCERVILLVGDTMTHAINHRDRAVVPLFGDAGTATLVERVPEPRPSWFSLHCDGKNWEYIKLSAGGYRLPKSAKTALESKDQDGNWRSDDDLWMNGMEIFNFSVREVPSSVRALAAYAGVGLESIEYLVFHQANRFIVENLARQLRVPLSKVPRDTAGKYGNQSSASIPATLCDALQEPLMSGSCRVLCSGFGVGLSWANCLITIGPLEHCSIGSCATPQVGPE